MPEIRTYEAGESSRTGPAIAYANTEDFGAGVARALAEVGEGADRASSGLAHIANTANVMNRRRQALEETRWAGDTYEATKRSISEFMANPENNTKDSFAQDLDRHNQDIFKGIDPQTAPTPRAFEMFKQNYWSFAGGKYAQALNVGYQNTVNNNITSINSQVNDAVTAYHNFKKVDEDVATHDMVDSVAHIGQNIEGSFRKLAPTIADRLQSDLITQATLAVMTNDPRAAKTLLDSSSSVDEQTRRTLNREIEQQLRSKDIVATEAFNNQRTDHLVGVEQGKSRDKIPISTYKQFYPDDQAQVQKSRDDNYIDAQNKANDILQKIGPQNSEAQLKELNALKSGVNNEQDAEVFKKVHQETVKNLKMQEQNPAGWLFQYNPTIKHLAQDAQDARDDQRMGKIQTLNDAVMRFQGPPPPGAKEDEKSQYLDRPMNDRHLMTLDEATQSASDLNQSTPREFIKKMGEVLSRYPDSQHQYVAFNDMVTIPSGRGGLRQEYQLAWQNKDAWWLDTYLGAVAAGKDIKLPEDVKKDVTKRIDANTTWLQFQSAMIGDNFSRASEISGFREGIQQYAHALISQGKSIKESGDGAVKMLISETLGITKVNGKPMIVLRDQGEKVPKMSDMEVTDLGRRLSVGLEQVDPRKIDQRPFAALQIFGKDEQHLPRLQALRDQITARGFFQTGPDGRSASLYMTDDNGMIFQVRDRGNRPLSINFRDLPLFKHFTTQEWMANLPGMPAERGFIPPKPSIPDRPSKHYDLLQQGYGDGGYNAYSNPWTHTVTNWPSDPSWLHAPVKPK